MNIKEQWQELKETITEMCDNDGTGTQQEVCKFLANYMDILEKQMQEPKTGHWEWMPSDDNPKLGDWHCSECRCVVVECVYKNEKRGIPLYKYCPQCGIKMGEPQESEDKDAT